jgi:hypothetical protein
MDGCNRKNSDRRNDDRRISKIEIEFDRRMSTRRMAGDRRTLEKVSK